MATLTLEQKFTRLCQIVQTLPKDGAFQLSNDNKLKFYSYYKQVTEGPCNTKQPNILKIVERAKWNAWNAIKDMTKEECMQAYIDEMRKAFAAFEKLDLAPKDHPTSLEIHALVD